MRGAAVLAAVLALVLPATAGAGEAAVAVTAGTSPQLIRFDTDAPGTVLDSVAVGGLTAGETIVALDVRPATGQLFALSDTGRMLVLDPASGQATQFGAAIAGTTPRIAFDFNAAADRLRIVQSDELNFRFNPVTATVIDTDGGAPGTQLDTTITYAPGDVNAGDDPDVVAAAYDRNDADGATPTTLFAIEDNNNVLVTQGGPDGIPSPNFGELSTIGGLGIDVDDAALDIVSPSGGPEAAYLATNGGLLRLDLGTGATTPIGSTSSVLGGFAILPGGALRAVGATVAESAASAVVTVTRSGDGLAATGVDYATQDGSATAGADYTITAGRLAFARGQRSADITVPLLGDTAAEGEEAFAVALSDLAPGAALDTAATVVRITDDDVGPPPSSQPEPDNVAPVLLVVPTAPKSLRALRRAGRMRVPFGCSEACRTALTLNLGDRRLGAGETTLQDAGVGRVVVRLSKAGKRALKRVKARRATLTLTGLAADRNNNRTTTSNRLRLRRR